VWASRWQCQCIKAFPLAPFIERYGLDITFNELQSRMRCQTCGDHPNSFSLPTNGRNCEYRFPPIDRVPVALRGYALVDPAHLPRRCGG
jgi:hypothetical protein